jgi:membrane protein YdbS with pleckstrin-like domain
VSPLRRRRGDTGFYGGGELAPLYPEPAPHDEESWERAQQAVRPEPPAEPPPVGFARPPGIFRRAGQGLDAWRRKVLPLPDEVIEQYLGHGERMIHSDHPSLQAFIVQNTILFGILAVVAGVFFPIAFNGSLVASGVTLLILSVVLLILVLKRLRERYTSYVVTNVRIMRISGVIARRAHSIPWVRVTDLTYEQSLSGRLFGYATLHIESANETMGLRELTGVPDPLSFNRYLMDMVVAKQGPSVPLGRRSDYAILPPRKGLFGKRQRAEVLQERSAVEVEPGAEPASGAAPDPQGQPGSPGPAGPGARPAEGPAGARRVRPAAPERAQPVAPDPAVGDLSDLARTAEHELAADRRRQASYYESDEGDERGPGD